ncbi:MAG: acyclic terpene utilization AtuA family protein, partial [Planctomycetaceae bacterium]
DPGRYLSPDATVSFLSLSVTDLGNDRVRVSGASGGPPPSTLKVSATYRDGYRASGTLTIVGRDAVAKADRVGEIVLQRVAGAGHQLRDTVVECLGTGDSVAGVMPRAASADAWETVLRIGVEAASREAVECFSRELMPLVTAGPQGACGYADGRPNVQTVVRYWPCLIERSMIVPQLAFITTSGSGVAADGPFVFKKMDSPATMSGVSTSTPPLSDPPVALYDVACSRSGDKGNNANVGIIARAAEDYGRLAQWLTAERVAAYFAPLGVDAVERFEMPNLGALNFVIQGVLRRRLRNDAQGKALGQALLELPLDEDFHALSGLRTLGSPHM